MSEPVNLTLFYSANLRGDLERLPRLYTFIKALVSGDRSRTAPTSEQFLLLDLGNACAPEVWHCAVTEGRSMLIGLDAMGYHAARVSITAAARARLHDNLLALALVDLDHPWQNGNILVTASDSSDQLSAENGLRVVLAPAATTYLDGRILHLADVQSEQVGIVQVSLEPALLYHRIETLPPQTLPDPTITATIDFVLSEARAVQRRRGGSS
ncbi:MAG TPA: hypothetical protein VHO69_13440 [Phototrophicaceae bacterium]|nr:hypothetical protein [Phototrophicaceae bacterium]